jgi:hypothetical protein
MYISVNTVKTHLRNIHRKLAATHRGEAVRRARQLGLIRCHEQGDGKHDTAGSNRPKARLSGQLAAEPRWPDKDVPRITMLSARRREGQPCSLTCS